MVDKEKGEHLRNGRVFGGRVGVRVDTSVTIARWTRLSLNAKRQILLGGRLSLNAKRQPRCIYLTFCPFTETCQR